MPQLFDPSARLRPLDDSEVPVDLSALAKRIRSSSKFRFDYQWYAAYNLPATVVGAGRLLETMVATPHLHEFLRVSFVAEYEDFFAIGPIHPKSRVIPGAPVANLAQAARDNLGARSMTIRPPPFGDVENVRRLFATAGTFEAFELEMQNWSGCEKRDHTDDRDQLVFSTWFYGILWDWCFCLIWKDMELAWIGCLTDTD